MVNPFFRKDFLATNDFTKKELDKVFDLAFKMKAKGAASKSLDILKGKTMLLLFFRPSTRTRISFTAAIQQLGGFVQVPDPSDMRLSLVDKPGAGESIKDTARVVERYVDAVGIRVGAPLPDANGALREGGGDAVQRRFAEFARVPVVNMSSCLHHPTQALGDMMVMQESLGREVKGKKIVMMWAYLPLLRIWTTPLSAGLISSTYGMDVTFAYPEGFDLDAGVMGQIKKECDKAGSKFEVTHDLKSAVEGAHVVFPRNWRSPNFYQNTKEEELRLAGMHKDWKFTEALLKKTNNARFIHCMPFDRGNEVDDSIADGPNSSVYDQAEDLVHVRKALLTLIMGEVDAASKI